MITVVIDSSWNVDTNGYPTPGYTNSNVWNAVKCAIDQWNTVQDPSGYTTGYYLVLDQAGKVPGYRDMTVQRSQVTTATGQPAYASSTTTYPYAIKLSPSNGNLGGGAFTDDDLCGRIAHEIGHELGLSNESSDCNSIMTGFNADGTRPVDHVSANDIYQVNRNFDDNTRTNGYCTGYTGDSGEQTHCEQSQVDECYSLGGIWDSDTCSCYTGGRDPNCCYYEPYEPYYDPYPGGGGGYTYCEYRCTDYYTCADAGDGPDCEYQDTDCELKACY